MNDLKLQYPKSWHDCKLPQESGCVYPLSIKDGTKQYWSRNTTEPNVIFSDSMVYEAKKTHDIKQTMCTMPEKKVKVATATRMKPITSNVEYKTVQTLENDGFYSVARTKNGKITGGYEAKPFTQKFAKGFKGKLQKFAINIATDFNGCERPVLKKVGGALFDLAKKIK